MLFQDACGKRKFEDHPGVLPGKLKAFSTASEEIETADTALPYPKMIFSNKWIINRRDFIPGRTIAANAAENQIVTSWGGFERAFIHNSRQK
ncbi:hypothetical protein [Alkalicoccus daliensis]|uniref:hypothetical protein n=1 Tax=Alkalicoccus daliensis TaxID=745820 RepID=UPI000B89D788|nr:hypothetical protein [Alkalicoccus daliensis]